MATPKTLFRLLKSLGPESPIRQDASQNPTIRAVRGLIFAAANRAEAESRRIISWVSGNLLNLALGWTTIVLLIAGIRVATSPTPADTWLHFAELVLPYMVVALSPILGFLVGRDAFRGKARLRHRQFRFARIGKWKSLDVREAMRHPSFGPVGFMASLVIGMLLNVVLRTIEFAISVPALSTAAPEWGFRLFWLIAADTAIMSFFYGVCFIMALRSVPLFPKMLLFVWIIDIMSQLTIAQWITGYAIPGVVAAPLESLLSGNIHKVLISMTIWLPYLILGERVNVTFRHRIPA